MRRNIRQAMRAKVKRQQEQMEAERQEMPEPRQISERQAALAKCSMRAQQRKG